MRFANPTAEPGETMAAGYLHCHVKLSHIDDWGHGGLTAALQLTYSLSGSHVDWSI